MNTNMHRVTEDLDDRFRQHEGDDLAAFSSEDDDPLNLLGSKWRDRVAAVVAITAILAAMFAPLPF